MEKSNDSVGLQLHFSGGKKPELLKVAFEDKSNGDGFDRTRKKNKSDTDPDKFDWKSGTQGFVLALLDYKLNGHANQGFYPFAGTTARSPAASACGVIDKQPWLKGGFGYEDATDREIATQIFKVQKDFADGKIAFQIDSGRLPPGNIEIFLGNEKKPLSVQDIKRLIAQIPWKPHRKAKAGKTTPEAVEVSVTPTIPRAQEPTGDALVEVSGLPPPAGVLVVTGNVPSPAMREHGGGSQRSELALAHRPDVQLEMPTPTMRPLPQSVRVSVCDPTQSSDGGLRLNLALRWGLSRTPGVVIIRDRDCGRVFSSLLEAEGMLQEAKRTMENEKQFARRIWFSIQEMPSAISDSAAWLAALTGHQEVAVGDREAFESRTATLGVMVRAGDSITVPQVMQEFIRRVADLFNQTAAFEPLIVIQTASTAITTPLMASILTAIDSSAGLHSEILEVLPGAERSQAIQREGSTVWGSPTMPGQALLSFVRRLDPDGSRLLRPEFAVLRNALGRLDPKAFSADGSDFPAFLHAQHIHSDLEHLQGNQVELARSLLALAREGDPSRVALKSLLEAMARASEPLMRAAALEAAVPDFELVETWLAGLPSDIRMNMPKWWVNACPAHLEAALAALVRQSKRGNEESRGVVQEWLPTINTSLQEAVRAVLNNAVGPGEGFWQSEHSGRTLLFLGECDPDLEIPIDEVSPALLVQPEFWQLVQGRPLTIELIRRFLRLPAEFRAVVGLCSQLEWDDLRTKHLLPQVFDRRGGRTNHNLT